MILFFEILYFHFHEMNAVIGKYLNIDPFSFTKI